jgi:hypothetical protein
MNNFLVFGNFLFTNIIIFRGIHEIANAMLSSQKVTKKDLTAKLS